MKGKELLLFLILALLIGLGATLDTFDYACKSNEDLSLGICYLKCNAGYVGYGNKCYVQCPPGMTQSDDGASCQKSNPVVLGTDILDCPNGYLKSATDPT